MAIYVRYTPTYETVNRVKTYIASVEMEMASDDLWRNFLKVLSARSNKHIGALGKIEQTRSNIERWRPRLATANLKARCRAGMSVGPNGRPTGCTSPGRTRRGARWLECCYADQAGR